MDLGLYWQISFEILDLLVHVLVVLLELEDVFEHLPHQALVLFAAGDCRCDHFLNIFTQPFF